MGKIDKTKPMEFRIWDNGSSPVPRRLIHNWKSCVFVGEYDDKRFLIKDSFPANTYDGQWTVGNDGWIKFSNGSKTGQVRNV